MNKTLPQSAYQDILGVNPNATLFLAILKLDFIHFGTFVDLYLDKQDDEPVINVIHYPHGKEIEESYKNSASFIDSQQYNDLQMMKTTFYVPVQFKPHALEIIHQSEIEIGDPDWNTRLQKLLTKGAEQLPSQAHEEHQARIQEAMDAAQRANQEAALEKSPVISDVKEMMPKREISESNRVEGQLPETIMEGLKESLAAKRKIIT